MNRIFEIKTSLGRIWHIKEEAIKKDFAELFVQDDGLTLKEAMAKVEAMDKKDIEGWFYDYWDLKMGASHGVSVGIKTPPSLHEALLAFETHFAVTSLDVYDEDNPYLAPVFDHTPIRPAREGVIGEIVFQREWQNLMSEPVNDDDADPSNPMLSLILEQCPFMLLQRHATVAASLVRWLGSNNGQGLLHSARAMAEVLGGEHNRSNAYLAAWAIDSKRHSSVNGGVRSVEGFLTAPGETSCFYDADDLEVIETVMYWLGSDRGQKFLTKCDEGIKTLLTKQKA
ncbi:hypothetical protein ACYPKM_02260 [Pseudomonas aeruginosa]